VIAGEIIKSGRDDECQQCRDNEGVCHKLSEEDSRYADDDDLALCDCPISRTGNFCEIVRGSSP